MARQESAFPFKGRIGKLTFFRDGNAYSTRQRTGVEGKRILNDAAFDITRRNMAEFGRAGLASKLIKTAFFDIQKNTADRRSSARLTRLMMEVIKADRTNEKGLRNILDGEVEMATGFEFNIQADLPTTLRAPFTTKITRSTGELTINFPEFIPADKVSAPEGATHFKIVSGGAEFDFENQTYSVQLQETAPIPLDRNPTAVIDLVHSVTANSTHPLILVMGIVYLDIVNGFQLSKRDKGYNALRIVEVSGV